MKLRQVVALAALLSTTARLCAIGIEPTSQDYGIVDSVGGPGINAESRPVYEWIEITGSGQLVVGAGMNHSSNSGAPNGIEAPVALPQPFPFYGEDITEIVPSSNGYLSTDPNDNGADVTPLCPPSAPSVGSGGRIYPLHAQLSLQAGVYFQYFEVSPHAYRRCGVSVFTWHKAENTANGSEFSFQALLFDNGDIITQYQASDTGSVPLATIGIQSADAAEGIDFHCGSALSFPAGDAVLFRSPEVHVNTGDSLETAIATVRNGGKVRIISTDHIAPSATITIKKSVCIDATTGRSTTGAFFTRREIDGQRAIRMFDVASNGRLLLVGGGLRNAASATSGGAISVLGELKICDADIHHNSCATGGGAIHVKGSGNAWLSGCNFWNNSAPGDGGAVFSDANGLRIDHCAFFDNHSGGRGGALAFESTLSDISIANSTFSRNSAEQPGAAISIIESQADIRHCTIAGNGKTATASAALHLEDASITVGHTILGPNISGSYSAVAGAHTSVGYNLDPDDDYTLLGSGDLKLDPLLSPLGLHGGRVFTLHPLIDSPALDKGRPSIPDAPQDDARGYPRIADSDTISGDRIDIGAVECGPVLVVDTTADEYHPVSLTTATGLREAVDTAPDGARIAFSPAMAGQEIMLTVRIDRTTGLQANGPDPAVYLRVDERSLFVDGSGLSSPPIIKTISAFDPVIFHQNFALVRHDTLRSRQAVSFHTVDFSSSGTNQTRYDTNIINLYHVGSGTMDATASFVNAVDTELRNVKAGGLMLEDLRVAEIKTGSYAIVNRAPGPDSIPSITRLHDTTHASSAVINDDFVEIARATQETGASLTSTNGDTTTFSDCAGARVAAYGVKLARVERCVSVGTEIGEGGTGGIGLSAGIAHVDSCVIANNITQGGNGAVFDIFAASGTVTNTTISGNHATIGGTQTEDNYGGDAPVSIVDVTVENCTIYDNTMVVYPQGPSGIFLGYSGGISGSAALKNTIVARNRYYNTEEKVWTHDNTIDFFNMTSLGNNLLDTDELSARGRAQASDLELTDPRLMPLRDHGGPAPTHMPLAASPAIDAIAGGSSLSTDGRGYYRVVAGSAVGGPRLDIGAVEATSPFLVKTALDTINGADPSLRDALPLENAAPYASYPTRIIFHPSSFPAGNIQLHGAGGGAGSPLAVENHCTIDATDIAGGVTIEGDQSFRLLNVGADRRANLVGLSFFKGGGPGGAGGIRNLGDLYIAHSTIYQNRSTNGDGAGIRNARSSSVLLAENCTFSGNQTLNGVGGAFASRVANPASLHAEFRHCTIADNTSSIAPGGLYLGGPTATLYANLFSNNLAAGTPDSLGFRAGNVTTSEGYNVYDDGGNTINQLSDQTSVSPAIATLADNGGLSLSHALLSTSPAIDVGLLNIQEENVPSMRDGRGFLRQLGAPGSLIDSGAFELGSRDQDGDGLPDSWETANALDPNDPSDAQVDNDFDGIINLDEFRGGTLPWDNYSRLGKFAPAPEFVADGTGGVGFAWSSTSITPPTQQPLFYTYQIESSSDLVDWFPYGGAISGSENDFSVAVDLADPRKFYRIRFALELSSQDLSGANLAGIDFSGADLSGSDLSGADLSGADLTGANFDGAIVDGADFDGANLYHAVGDIQFTSFAGTPGDAVEMSLPEFYPDFSDAHFSSDHPDAVGAPISHNTFVVMFAPGVTVSQANASIAAVGATIAGCRPAEAPGDAAIFCLRVPTANHFAAAPLLATLESDPNVLHVTPEWLVDTEAIPDPGAATAKWDDWSQSDDQDGNWGMKYSRIPQLWNFNEAVQKKIDNGQSNRIPSVGIVDDAFLHRHKDLSPLDLTAIPGHYDRTEDHGSHTLGILAAAHGNGGTDGVTPFGKFTAVQWKVDPQDTLGTFLFTRQGALVRECGRRSQARVVSTSNGYSSRLVSASAAAQQQFLQWYSTRAKMFVAERDPINDPIIVDSAGNSAIPALYGDPMAYAALVDNVPGIFVVEALDRDGSLASFSNFGGNISAPGVDITCLTFSSGYKEANGTSLAAPQVAGTIAYLFALQPELTNTQIETLLYDNINAVGRGNGLDAWAAAMDIDTLRGGNEIIQMLLDIDDGSKDGNLRLIYSVDLAADDENEDPTNPATPVAWKINDDIDGDLGIGDGRIDMSDFRRFRDWSAIAALHGPPARLDGPADHPKHDANRNGIVEEEAESYYPRTDFNGDGIGTCSQDTSPVPGVLNGADATDLEVLQASGLFNDPHYNATDLQDLCESADIHFNFYWFTEYQNTHEELPGVNIKVYNLTTMTLEKTISDLDIPALPETEGSDLVLTFKSGNSYEISVWSNDPSSESDLIGEKRVFNFDQALVDHWFPARAFDTFKLE